MFLRTNLPASNPSLEGHHTLGLQVRPSPAPTRAESHRRHTSFSLWFCSHSHLPNRKRNPHIHTHTRSSAGAGAVGAAVTLSTSPSLSAEPSRNQKGRHSLEMPARERLSSEKGAFPPLLLAVRGRLSTQVSRNSPHSYDSLTKLLK